MQKSSKTIKKLQNVQNNQNHLNTYIQNITNHYKILCLDGSKSGFKMFHIKIIQDILSIIKHQVSLFVLICAYLSLGVLICCYLMLFDSISTYFGSIGFVHFMSITSFDISKDMDNAATPLPPPPEAPESLPLHPCACSALDCRAVAVFFSEIHVHLQLFQTLPIVSLQRG